MSEYIYPYCASYPTVPYNFVYNPPTYSMPAVGSIPVKICRTCGLPGIWIPLYERWYCYFDRKYI